MPSRLQPYFRVAAISGAAHPASSSAPEPVRLVFQRDSQRLLTLGDKSASCRMSLNRAVRSASLMVANSGRGRCAVEIRSRCVIRQMRVAPGSPITPGGVALLACGLACWLGVFVDQSHQPGQRRGRDDDIGNDDVGRNAHAPQPRTAAVGAGRPSSGV